MIESSKPDPNMFYPEYEFTSKKLKKYDEVIEKLDPARLTTWTGSSWNARARLGLL